MRRLSTRSVLLLLLAGACLVTLTKLLPLLTKIGNPPTASLSSVWQPWPQEDLWEVIKGYEEGNTYLAESVSLSRWFYGYPPPSSGEVRSEVHYDTSDLQRFDLTDSSLFFRWRPAINEGEDDYYMSFLARDDEDGDGNSVSILVEVEVAAGGGDPSITTLTDPDPPFTDPPGSYDYPGDAAWDPTGTYLAFGGYNDDFDAFFAWYKKSGSTLTKLSLPSPAPQGATGLAWDETGTYLAIGSNAWEGYDEAIYLYKRSGDTLALVDTVTSAGTFYIGKLIWLGSYLVAGSYSSFTMPWGSGSDGIGVYSRSGDSLSFVDSVTGEVDVNSFDISPDGDYLLAALVNFNNANDLEGWVLSWDGAGSLAVVETVNLGGNNQPNRGSWSEDGDYFAISTGYDTDGWGMTLYSWGAGTETATVQSQADSGQHDYSGWDAISIGNYWLVTGRDDGAGGDNPQIRVLENTAGTLSWVVDSDADPFSSFFVQGALHPDGDYLATIHENDNIISWFALSGFAGGASGPQLKITVDDNAPVVVSPYSPDTHAWLRVRHSASGASVLVDTAAIGCGSWVNQANLPLASGNDVRKLGIAMRAWVDTHADEAASPSPGSFGPWNPDAEEHVLYLLTKIGPVTEMGRVVATLPLLTQTGPVAE